jgi:hypothetical protein
MFNYNRGLAIHSFLSRFGHTIGTVVGSESLLPTHLSKGSLVFVGNVGRHDGIDNQMSESLELFLRLIDAISEVSIGWFHQEIPSNIGRVLFGHTLVLVRLGIVVSKLGQNLLAELDTVWVLLVIMGLGALRNDLLDLGKDYGAFWLLDCQPFECLGDYFSWR